MDKISCEIIKDLMPSYLDEICSEESSKLVENHLNGCQECKELLEKMDKTEIISSDTDKYQIDYMKKVKNSFHRRNYIGFLLLLSFLIIGFLIVLGNYGNTPIELYYITTPIMILASSIVIYQPVKSKNTKTLNKYKVILGIIGLFGVTYTLFLGSNMAKWGNSGKYPFSLQSHQMGPFVFYQLIVLTIIELVILVYTVWATINKGENFKLISNINIIGINLALILVSILKTLDSVDYYITTRNTAFIIIIAEGIVTGLITHLIIRYKNQNII